MRTSCLSRKFEKFVCFSVFCVPPLHDNARKNTKHKLFCKKGMKQLVYIILGNVLKKLSTAEMGYLRFYKNS
jgi:hypothetical protein